MSALSPVLRQLAEGSVAFWCPGCKTSHVISPGIWSWDGNAVAPTFSPSVLVRSGHYIDGKRPCWCTYNAEHPDDLAPFKCGQCHSFVKAGQIQFLSDCTHDLAGKTVPLPEFP